MSDLFDILVANEAFKYLVSEHSKKYIRLAWKNNTYITILGSEGTKKSFIKNWVPQYGRFVRCILFYDFFNWLSFSHFEPIAQWQ